MKPLFADTSFYVATVNPLDARHETALEFLRQYRGGLITTEYVLLETGNWLARSGDKPVFIRLVESLMSDPAITILPGEPSLLRAGLDLYRRRLDKDWSLTDCTSFVVMEKLHLTEALTADHHFEQAGFKALLK